MSTELPRDGQVVEVLFRGHWRALDVTEGTMRRRPYERIVYVQAPAAPAARLPLPEGDAMLVVPPDLSPESHGRFATWLRLMIDLSKPADPS